MSARTSVVINALPATASGAASAISTATVKLGWTIGNLLVTTFFLAVVGTDYLPQMSATGMSPEQIREATAIWTTQPPWAPPLSQEDLVEQLRAASSYHAIRTRAQ